MPPKSAEKVEQKIAYSIGRLRIITVSVDGGFSAYLEGSPAGIVETGKTEAQAIGLLVKHIASAVQLPFSSVGPSESKN